MRREGTWLMFPSKKIKMCRLARLGELGSPGRATPAPNYKNDERGGIFAFKNFFSPFQKPYPRDLRVCSPRVIIFRIFLIPFRTFVHHQQVSVPSLSFLAFHWCILISFWCSKLWECAQIYGAILVCFLAWLGWIRGLYGMALGL